MLKRENIFEIVYCKGNIIKFGALYFKHNFTFSLHVSLLTQQYSKSVFQLLIFKSRARRNGHVPPNRQEQLKCVTQ